VSFEYGVDAARTGKGKGGSAADTRERERERGRELDRPLIHNENRIARNSDENATMKATLAFSIRGDLTIRVRRKEHD